MIKRALWLGKPQYSSDCPASRLSPPWERQGEAPQVQAPLLGRGWGRSYKLALPSLGGAGEGSSSRLSPPWERQGEAPQVQAPLLGRGWGRSYKSALPSLGEVGGGYASQHSPPLGRGRGWVFVIFFYKCFRRKGRIEKQTHYGRKYASFEPVCNALTMRML